LYFLVWRELKVRYKQTFIGAAWAILQPLTAMLIFTIIFGYFIKIPSNNIPYPIFVYSALLPWNYFAQAVERSSNSLVENANLISKVYFPRIIVVLASIITPLIDFALAFVILLAMMVYFRVAPSWKILLVIPFLSLAVVAATAISLWLSAVNVKYRDVRYVIPFLVQVWMYASPIIYSTEVMPPFIRTFYGINPMVGVIEGFRWALLGSSEFDLKLLGVSVLVMLFLLVTGLFYFKHVEQTLADVI
jgi:lipopolysaccharide transport system permease protein